MMFHFHFNFCFIEKFIYILLLGYVSSCQFNNKECGKFFLNQTLECDYFNLDRPKEHSQKPGAATGLILNIFPKPYQKDPSELTYITIFYRHMDENKKVNIIPGTIKFIKLERVFQKKLGKTVKDIILLPARIF